MSYTVADVGNAQEVVFTTAGGLGESEVGGPAMNLVPRQGGNTYSGVVLRQRGQRLVPDQQLHRRDSRRAGLRAPNLMTKIWDVNGAFGGPIRKDRLWFFAAVRYQGNRKLVAGMFDNQNAGDVNAWTYVADRHPGDRRWHVEERQRPADAGRRRRATSSTSSGTSSGSARRASAAAARRRRRKRAATTTRRPRVQQVTLVLAGDQPAAARGRAGAAT